MAGRCTEIGCVLTSIVIVEGGGGRDERSGLPSATIFGSELSELIFVHLVIGLAGLTGAMNELKW